MARYGKAFKTRTVAKLLPPSSRPLEEVSGETGISVDALERWRSESLTMAAGERWRRKVGQLGR